MDIMVSIQGMKSWSYPCIQWCTIDMEKPFALFPYPPYSILMLSLHHALWVSFNTNLWQKNKNLSISSLPYPCVSFWVYLNKCFGVRGSSYVFVLTSFYLKAQGKINYTHYFNPTFMVIVGLKEIHCGRHSISKGMHFIV